MHQSEEGELLDAIADTLYVLLSLAPTNVKQLVKVRYKGEVLEVPLNVVLLLKLTDRLVQTLSQIFREILASPTKLVEERVIVDRRIAGPLHIPLTVQLKGKGVQMVAYRERLVSLASPENVLLAIFLLRLSRDSEKVLVELSRVKQSGSRGRALVLGPLLDRLEDRVKELRGEIERMRATPLFRQLRVEHLSPDDATLLKYAKVVLRRGRKKYRKLALLAQDYVRRKPLELLHHDMCAAKKAEVIGVQAYKFYEVFSYYLTAVALVETLEASSVVLDGDTIEIHSKVGRLRLLYDTPLRGASWLGLGKLKYDEVEERVVPPGRPDVMLVLNNGGNRGGRPLLVLDAKYTKSLSYLSQARYKILGYLHEYGATLGAIVYDPTRLNREEQALEDEEEREFVKIIEKASEHGGAVIEDATARVYLLPLRASKYSELRSSNTYSIMCRMLKESVSSLTYR